VKEETIALSGFPAGYENQCQILLWNGIKMIEEEKEFAERALKQFTSFQNVFGLVNPEGNEAKQFEKRLLEGTKDVTGAMVHQVINNLIYIAQNGKEKWLDTVRKDDPGRVFEWDGTEASCPNVAA
jgi:hypothetical protein